MEEIQEIEFQKIQLIPKTDRTKKMVEEHGEFFQRLVDIGGGNLLQSIPPGKAWWVNGAEAEFVDVDGE
jgi:hypothetical protein